MLSILCDLICDVVPIHQIRIFNVLKITDVIKKSTETKSIYEQLSIMSQNEWWNRYVFSLWQKSVEEEDD